VQKRWISFFYLAGDLNDLQDESGKTEESSQTSARHGDSLSGTCSVDGGWLGWLGARWSGGLVVASIAVHNGRGIHWPGDGARAVSDGEGGGLGDVVSLAVVDQRRGGRAVSGDGGNDISHVGDVVTGHDGGGASKGSESNDGLHFDGLVWRLNFDNSGD